MTTKSEDKQVIDNIVDGMVSDFWKGKDPIQLAQSQFNDMLLIISEKPINKEKLKKHATTTGILCASNTLFNQEMNRLIACAKWSADLTEHDVL